METITLPDGDSYEITFSDKPLTVGQMRQFTDSDRSQAQRGLLMFDLIVAGVKHNGKKRKIDDLPVTAIDPIITRYNELFMTAQES